MTPAPWQFGELRMFGYDLLSIDPPWTFDLRSAKGEDKSAQAQYDCMTIDEICALPVGQLLRGGTSAAAMWCTWPLVAKGLHVRVLESWGLVPVTGGDWSKRTASGKRRMGPGYVMRTVCEPFIIARLGDTKGLRGPSIPNQLETLDDELDGVVFDGIAREHSRKPEEWFAMLEALSPGATRAELFARQRRAGWDTWGNEVDKFAAGAGA